MAKETSDSDAECGLFVVKWIAIIGAWCLLIIGISTNVFTIVKISVAPKVYIIEYVVDQVQDYQMHHRQ